MKNGDTKTQIADLDGNLFQAGTQITATAAELNKMDGVTSTAAEINTLDLSVVGAISKVVKANMVAADFSDNSEVDTGITLPAKAVVKNVFVYVNTAETTATTKTIDVGTDSTDSGDADGYIDAGSVAATGFVKPTLLNTGQTLGALLRVDEDGAGALVPEVDVASGGKKVTVTAGDASGFTEADFDIYVEYVEVA